MFTAKHIHSPPFTVAPLYQSMNEPSSQNEPHLRIIVNKENPRRNIPSGEKQFTQSNVMVQDLVKFNIQPASQEKSPLSYMIPSSYREMIKLQNISSRKNSNHNAKTSQRDAIPSLPKRIKLLKSRSQLNNTESTLSSSQSRSRKSGDNPTIPPLPSLHRVSNPRHFHQHHHIS